jgi:hypothetical protein
MDPWDPCFLFRIFATWNEELDDFILERKNPEFPAHVRSRAKDRQRARSRSRDRPSLYPNMEEPKKMVILRLLQDGPDVRDYLEQMILEASDAIRHQKDMRHKVLERQRALPPIAELTTRNHVVPLVPNFIDDAIERQRLAARRWAPTIEARGRV